MQNINQAMTTSTEENIKSTNGDIDNNSQQRKKERIKGIVSIILWVVLYIGGGLILNLLLFAINAVTGIYSEEIFIAIIIYGPAVIVTIVFVFRYLKTLKEDIKRLTKKNIIFVAIMGATTIILIRVISIIFGMLNIVVSNDNAVAELAAASFMPIFLVVIIYGPVVEELLFRKALSQIINNKVIFFIISVILFGLLHEGINISAIGTMLTGACFTVTYIKTDKNIIASMIVHSISNLVGMLIMLLFGI